MLSDLAAVTKIGSALLPRIASASLSEVEDLSRASNPVVRMLLAERGDLPAEIRNMLADDPDAKVVKSIARHPGLSEAQLRSMIERHGSRVIAKVAANPEAPSALLEYLTGYMTPVRKALREVARHRNATGRALLVCLTDQDARRIAAGHAALPPETIVELLADHDWQVVEAAAANPSLPPAVMARLIPEFNGA